MKFKPLFFLISLVFVCCFCSNVFSTPKEYILQAHINSENGLPQNSIRDAIFSPSGFLWVATEDGLVRFDGKNSRIFNTSNSGLTKNRLTQLILMDDGKLYCLTEESLLFEIKEKTKSIEIVSTQKILLLGFSAYHFFKSDSIQSFIKKCNHILPENLSNDFQTIIFVLKKQHCIVQRCKKGLLVYDYENQTSKLISIAHQEKIDFFVQNELLYGKKNVHDFFQIDIETGKQSTLIFNLKNEPSPIATHSNLNNDKLFWDYKTSKTFYIHQNKLFEIIIENNKLFFELKIKNLPTQLISNITVSDDRQTFVIGTFSNGLFSYQQKKMNTILSSNNTNSFYAQTLNKTTNRIVTSYPFQEQNENETKKLSPYFAFNNNTLYTDSKNTVWVAWSDTLGAYSLITNKIINKIMIPNNLGLGIGFIDYRDSTSIYVSSNRCLYYYKIDSGLVELGAYNFKKNESQRAYCMLQDGDSLLWIGTSEGIYKYNIQSNKITLCCLPTIAVRTIIKTSTGTILAGTYGAGIYAIINNKSIAIPLDKNENLKATHTIIEDKNNFLWMTTNNGLYKIPLYEIDNYISKKENLILYYYRYSHEDGLLTNEFNGGCFPSALQINDTTWSLPSMQGLVWLNPKWLSTTFNKSAVFIDKVMINDSVWNIQNENIIEVPTHNFRLSIFLSSPNWSDANNLYIEYKLDDDDKWILLKNNNVPLLIQNLQGGKHILYIRKKTGSLPTDFAQTELQIAVPKWIYEFWWFWPAAIILLLVLIYFLNKFSNLQIKKRKENLEQIVQLKTTELKNAIADLKIKNATIENAKHQLKHENEMKSNLLYVLSHDIATPLRFMNRFLSHATKSENNSTLDFDDLVDLKISTQNLETLLDNIVAWIKQTDENQLNTTIIDLDLNKIITEKIKLFSLTCKKKNNTIINLMSANTIIESDQFIISMAIQNLLGNAINYTKNGQIKISFEETINEQKIIIKDNGIGIQQKLIIERNHLSTELDHTLLGYGIGLKVTGELLKLINGEITLINNENHAGTTAIIYIRKINYRYVH